MLRVLKELGPPINESFTISTMPVMNYLSLHGVVNVVMVVAVVVVMARHYSPRPLYVPCHYHRLPFPACCLKFKALL